MYRTYGMTVANRGSQAVDSDGFLCIQNKSIYSSGWKERADKRILWFFMVSVENI